MCHDDSVTDMVEDLPRIARRMDDQCLCSEHWRWIVASRVGMIDLKYVAENSWPPNVKRSYQTGAERGGRSLDLSESDEVRRQIAVIIENTQGCTDI